jgi:hypothetical protein
MQYRRDVVQRQNPRSIGAADPAHPYTFQDKRAEVFPASLCQGDMK